MAAQRRHDGEMLFFTRGFAPDVNADRLLAAAAADYQVILTQQEVLQDASDTVDAAMAWWPASIPYLEYSDSTEALWRAAADATSELADLLGGRLNVPGKPAAPQESSGRPVSGAGQTDSERMIERIRLGTFDTQSLAPRGKALSYAWSQGLINAIRQEKDVWKQDRLARVFPPLEPMSLLDEPVTNPTVRLHRKRNEALWAWLADWYRYEVRDRANPGFYAELSSEYSQWLAEKPETYIDVTGPSTLDELTPGGPPVACTLDWKLVAPAGTKAVVQAEVLNAAAPWLRIVLLDAKDRSVLATESIPIEIAQPRQYVDPFRAARAGQQSSGGGAARRGGSAGWTLYG